MMLDQSLANPAGRLMVLRDADPFGADTAVEVILVRYSNDADHFLQCEATLADDDVALWPAFADACLAASADWL